MDPYVHEYMFRGWGGAKPNDWHLQLAENFQGANGAVTVEGPLLTAEQAEAAGWSIDRVMADINGQMATEIEDLRVALNASKRARDGAEQLYLEAKAIADQYPALAADYRAACLEIERLSDIVQDDVRLRTDLEAAQKALAATEKWYAAARETADRYPALEADYRAARLEIERLKIEIEAQAAPPID